jgi:hypothetical protein
MSLESTIGLDLNAYKSPQTSGVKWLFTGRALLSKLGIRPSTPITVPGSVFMLKGLVSTGLSRYPKGSIGSKICSAHEPSSGGGVYR